MVNFRTKRRNTKDRRIKDKKEKEKDGETYIGEEWNRRERGETRPPCVPGSPRPNALLDLSVPPCFLLWRRRRGETNAVTRRGIAAATCHVETKSRYCWGFGDAVTMVTAFDDQYFSHATSWARFMQLKGRLQRAMTWQHVLVFGQKYINGVKKKKKCKRP